MKLVRLAPLIVLCLAFTVSAQLQPQHSVTGRAEIKKNAAEQLAYARQLINAIPATADQHRRMEPAWNAVTALRLIPARWPNEKAIVTESLLLQEYVLLNENFLTVALAALHDAEKSAAGTDAMARVYSEEGLVYRRQHQEEEAAAAFDRAARHAAFHTLAIPKLVGTLSEYADVESRLGRHQQAAAHLRAAAEIPSLPPFNRVGLMLRSFEQNDQLSDKTEARKDLAKIDDLMLEAKRTLTSSPSEIAMVNEYEKEVKRHHARLGV